MAWALARVWALGFRVLGFRIQISGFRANLGPLRGNVEKVVGIGARKGKRKMRPRRRYCTAAYTIGFRGLGVRV